uniref:calcium-binding protein n=1 Tax=uncultured Sphingomonas sp. TaxID=158754 RepID=UPI0025FD1EC8|nr:hypothetical protein [uncultured Sphingomonas sp.]
MVKLSAIKSLYHKGSKGSDLLVGGNGADMIKGKHGDDVLIGRGGGDMLTGGHGADSFKYFSFGDSRGRHIDLITDFDAGEGDKVDLRPLGTATLQPSYNAALGTLQAVFTYDAGTDRTTLSYLQGSSTPVFQVQFKGEVRYSADAFLGIVRPAGPTEGNDKLTGTAGNDTVDLLGGNDSYDGLGGNDTIRGGAGNDLLRGGSNDDTIFGGQGNDTIIGGTHGDNLHGGTGADRFVYLEQADSAPYLGPNSGVDRIHDFNSAQGDKIDLTALAPNGFYLDDSFRTDLVASGKGQIILTQSSDGTYLLRIFLPGDRREDMHIVLNTSVTAGDFLGVEKAPPPVPTEGYDDLIGTSGDDTIDLLGGSDIYDGLAGNDTINGGGGDDTLFGGIGNDYLRGDADNDRLVGGPGNDYLQGFEGSDVLTGGTGADTFWYPWLYNVGDVDTITDFNRAEGDKIDLWSSRVGRFANLGWVLVDDAFSPAADANHDAGQIVQVANSDGTYTLSFYYSNQTSPSFKIIVNTKLIPSDFLGDNWVQYPASPTEGADSFVGFNGSDRIDLLGGDDVYDGLSGNDEIVGGAGNDTLRGGNPIGTTIGGSRIEGGSGNDLLIAGSGQDVLYGGTGADRLFGGDGGDLLVGEDGDDTLSGGLGGDYLSGQGGADTYLYSHIGESPVATSSGPLRFPLDFGYGQPDTIFGFDPAAGDVIDLRQLDTDLATAGVQTAAWTFTGSAYDSSVGGAQITLTLGTIYTYDTTGTAYPQAGTTLSLYLDDGDAIADFQIQLTGSHTTVQGILW